MKIIAFVAALFLLGACATAAPGAASVTPPSNGPAAAAAPSRAMQVLASAGRANASTQAEVERALGRPDIARQDGAGAALTYRLETCALLLLFEADARNDLRLAEAHPGARVAGAAPPSLGQCAAEASAR